ncbi:hypothetical protein PBT90_17165 [Algoriphagus halophytocola]|uniref:Uncharacterized protein n=1 Tax=Algoriphagus halophytocola TaxID=2991499 RepID=A0ABY6MF43_9BACT|nr:MULTISPECIES: hypothetical protein [unclassified Algoriphagus]UZD21256.1 hypothetical protein OM944_11300 [Algoriphagus sp. TR-M5]WBL42467.1 hypothetical protein PBT90_17165 [Algoriphagus sp. TR-M9]
MDIRNEASTQYLFAHLVSRPVLRLRSAQVTGDLPLPSVRPKRP